MAAEPPFTANPIAVTERTRKGHYVVRMMIPPRTGWKQAGMHQRFETRVEAQAYIAKLAVDHEAAVLYDHPTAIAPSWGEL